MIWLDVLSSTIFNRTDLVAGAVIDGGAFDLGRENSRGMAAAGRHAFLQFG
jgi:hypothetical protein